jgi:SAM-dependent methyltransferase
MNEQDQPIARPDILATLLAETPQAGENQVVLDLLGSDQRDQQVESYEASFVAAKDEGGSIYGSMEAMPAIIQAAHERRMQILDSLPVGDVSNKVCVDYGVGSWGFACIYPRLQHCAYAIGVDISYAAVRESAALSAGGAFPYGANYVYLTSRGDDIKLRDASADIFFAGECIEHVENTDAFLDEIHRILKPNGLLILTTPNAAAYLYRARGEQYCIGPEHVALMSYEELRAYVDPRFELLAAHGFNGSLHYEWDASLSDLEWARMWAAQCYDRPDLGTGIVLMARRRDDYQHARYNQRYYHSDDPAVYYEGNWVTLPLHKVMTGKGAAGNEPASLSLDFDGNGIILNFWCHQWSGHALIEVDGAAQQVNLFSHQGGFVRIHVPDLTPGQHRLRVVSLNSRDAHSEGSEVIFYQAISYQRHG